MDRLRAGAPPTAKLREELSLLKDVVLGEGPGRDRNLTPLGAQTPSPSAQGSRGGLSQLRTTSAVTCERPEALGPSALICLLDLASLLFTI